MKPERRLAQQEECFSRKPCACLYRSGSGPGNLRILSLLKTEKREMTIAEMAEATGWNKAVFISFC
jgi:hypothetical protein